MTSLICDIERDKGKGLVPNDDRPLTLYYKTQMSMCVSVYCMSGDVGNEEWNRGDKRETMV